MTNKFTPGPWEAWGDGYVRWPGCKNRAGRRSHSLVCSVGSPGANEMRSMGFGYGNYEQAREIQAANARLIATAPDLLAACRAVLAYDASILGRAARGEVDLLTGGGGARPGMTWTDFMMRW